MRLLCVTAHPDDEAGGFGGALLLYGERGVETNVLCLTPGQAATHRGPAASGEELAALRRQEFQVACKMLKVRHGEVLNYPDGGLEKQNFLEVVADLTRRMREFRPHVVITMGAEGAVTAHVDHTMASIFTTAAYHWAGRSNRFSEQLTGGLIPHRAQKLYYGTAGFTLPDRQPVCLPPATTVLHVGERLETKIAAFRCHTTQAPLFDMFEMAVRRRGLEEWYHLAYASTPRMSERETDLFAGVVDD